MEEVIRIINDVGFSVVLVGYFIYKDYKFNSQIITVLDNINKVLAKLETWHAKEGFE